MSDDLEERVERIEAELGYAIVEESDDAIFGATLLIDEDGDVWFTDDEGDVLWDDGPHFLSTGEVERLAERAREVADDA